MSKYIIGYDVEYGGGLWRDDVVIKYKIKNIPLMKKFFGNYKQVMLLKILDRHFDDYNLPLLDDVNELIHDDRYVYIGYKQLKKVVSNDRKNEEYEYLYIFCFEWNYFESIRKKYPLLSYIYNLRIEATREDRMRRSSLIDPMDYDLFY